MKNIFVFFILPFSICFSQNNFTFPFGTDSSRWIYDYRSALFAYTFKTSIQYGKDTLMPNNQTYRSYGPYYYFRKDGSKIYQYVRNDSSEFVRYDFSKQIGDTVSFIRRGNDSSAIVMTDDYSGSVFGQSRRILSFHSNGDVWDDVADSIGIIFFSLDIETGFELAGAIISGKIFGDITSVVNQNNLIPNKPNLSQNYPNPFNPSTTITFSLRSRSFVSLKIYNVLGKEIATIVSEELSAGTYSRRWNPQEISSGIYFYRFRSGSFVETKKLVLMK